jgi:hypothetical protein
MAIWVKIRLCTVKVRLQIDGLRSVYGIILAHRLEETVGAKVSRLATELSVLISPLAGEMSDRTERGAAVVFKAEARRSFQL